MSSGRPFRAARHQSPPIWTLGPLSESSPGLRCCLCLKKQAAPGAACWKKDRQPVRALVASERWRAPAAETAPVCTPLRIGWPGCLRPPPASSGEEAENRRVTAAQKPRQLGPSPALPTVTLFANAACRLIGPIRRTSPCQPLRLRHSLASRAANGRALTRLPHNKFMRKLAGWSARIRSFLP